METNKKQNWPLFTIKLHTVLAGFFLPTAIMFAITGGLYTFGVKGDYKNDNKTIVSALAEKPNLDELHNVAKKIITEDFSAPHPSGSYSLKKVGTSWQFEWTGSRADFTLEPTSTPGSYKASYKATNLHRYFVQLHKAKGGLPFKFMAAGLALAFISLFASGVMIAFGRVNLRPLLFISLGLGTALSVVLATLS